MPVQNDPLQISPYTSTVPMVQIPPEQIQAQTTPAPPLQGQFGKKGNSTLAIGDALLKGFITGHQQKEQRKNAQAQATITAADAASEAAYTKYQDALTQASGKVDDPNAQAAYQAYQKTFEQAKQAKAAFVIPEKPAKGQSGQQKKGVKGEVKSGFNNIKDFFEANPHIVPQIALLTMQPKPPGQTAEGKAQNLELARQQQVLAEGNVEASESKRRQDAEKTYDLYSGLNETELAALPREEQQKFQAARNIIFQQHGSTGLKEYASPDGAHRDWFLPGQQPGGWEATQGTSSGQPKIGTEGEFTAQAYKKYGVTAQNATPELSKYIHDWWQWKAAQSSSSTSGTTVDVHGNRTTTNAATRGIPEPKPPAGFQPIEDPDRQAGGITPPPQASAAPKGGISRPPAAPQAAPGRMAKPPAAPTLTDAARTEKVETEKANRFRKAQEDYDKAIADARKQASRSNNPITQDQLNALVKTASENRDAAWKAAGDWYTQQVHAAGGQMPGELPPHAKEKLQPGIVTFFGNGQQWTLDTNGQPKQVK